MAPSQTPTTLVVRHGLQALWLFGTHGGSYLTFFFSGDNLVFGFAKDGKFTTSASGSIPAS